MMKVVVMTSSGFTSLTKKEVALFTQADINNRNTLGVLAWR
jgi:hypothetical protein